MTLRQIARQAGYQLTACNGGQTFRLWNKDGCIRCSNASDVKKHLKSIHRRDKPQ